MKSFLKTILITVSFITLVTSCDEPAAVVSNKVEPIHLDDIHYIVTHEDSTVAFFQRHFGAREMAHPGDRFDLVRFLSLKWQGPTLTITPIGPYSDLPADRNKRWIDKKIITPRSAKTEPFYGSKWLAIRTPSLPKARTELIEGGVEISEDKISLPMEPNADAFSIYGPDGAEIVIVERPKYDFGDASYAIDHLQFLVEDIKTAQTFFEDVLAAKEIKSEKGSIGLQVADAKLIFSEPEAFGLNSEDVASTSDQDSIRIGLGHLGFLYKDVQKAVDQGEAKGHSPIFPPQKYVYKNKPTVYTFTAYSLTESFNIEMVQAEGRIGPHSYYMDQCDEKETP